MAGKSGGSKDGKAKAKAKSKAKGAVKGKNAFARFFDRSGRERTAFLLVGLLVVAVVAALLLALPGLKDSLFSLVGITQATQPPLPVGQGSFGPVSVHFIAVGQGDAVLLEADGEFALIDAGPPEGQDALLAYLRGAGVQRLRYMVMTHPHADHIGGMEAVVEQFEVGQALLPDFDKGPLPTTSLFEGVLAALAEGGVATETARAGGVYPLGSGSLTVLQDGLASADNLNLLSLITLFEAEGLRYLSTGDAEAANEKALLQSGTLVSAQLFHAGHHGSSTSNTADFVAAVRPSLVVVSSGEGNDYGHPHQGPLGRYAEVGALVLNTAEVGHVRAGPGADGVLIYGVSKPEALDGGAMPQDGPSQDEVLPDIAA